MFMYQSKQRTNNKKETTDTVSTRKQFKERNTMYKKIGLVLALIVAFTMLPWNIATVYAAPGDELEYTEAAITKILKTPYGTALDPDMKFVFDIERIHEEENGQPTVNMPVLGVAKDVNTGTVTITPAAEKYYKNTLDNYDIYYWQSDDILDGVTWNHAGLYEYKITENKTLSYHPKTEEPENNVLPIEDIEYSDAEYKMKIYVSNTNEGPKVTHIGLTRLIDDNGTEVTAGAQVKLDPTPGPGGGVNKFSGFTFSNSYIKTNKGTVIIDSEHWTLSISKTTNGEYGDKTAYFMYSLTLTVPTPLNLKNNSRNDSYNAYVYGKDPEDGVWKQVSDLVNNGYPSVSYITFTPSGVGTATATFNLKNDQKLVFLDLPVGTSYIMNETAATGYTPTAAVKYNSEAAVVHEGIKGQAYYLPNPITALPNPHIITSAILYVGEGTNSVEFNNTRDSILVTGLNINDLPFIIMILLAVCAIAVYTVYKTRKSKDNS